MKKYIILCVLTILIFGALNFLTTKDQRPVDGNYFLGFPLTFHIESSEMVDPAPQSAEDLVRNNYLFLVIDVLFAFVISYILWILYQRFVNRNQSGNEV